MAVVYSSISSNVVAVVPFKSTVNSHFFAVSLSSRKPKITKSTFQKIAGNLSEYSWEKSGEIKKTISYKWVFIGFPLEF